MMIKGKRQNLHNQALDMCIYIYNLIGNENYLYLMNFSLPAEEVAVMGNAMENHRMKNKQNHIPLAQVLKQRKTMYMSENQN